MAQVIKLKISEVIKIYGSKSLIETVKLLLDQAVVMGDCGVKRMLLALRTYSDEGLCAVDLVQQWIQQTANQVLYVLLERVASR